MPAIMKRLKTFQSSDSRIPYLPALAGSFHRSQPWSSAASRLTLSVLTTKEYGPKRWAMPISSLPSSDIAQR